jgi:hypothetical protein
MQDLSPAPIHLDFGAAFSDAGPYLECNHLARKRGGRLPSDLCLALPPWSRRLVLRWRQSRLQQKGDDILACLASSRSLLKAMLRPSI